MSRSKYQRWIVIPNWDKYQHYKRRDPAWIKLYRGLLHDPDWLELSSSEQALLVGLWMLTAQLGNGRVPADRKYIAQQMQLTSGEAAWLNLHLDSLREAGWIELDASRALARAREETETETEKTPKVFSGPKPNRARAREAAPPSDGATPSAPGNSDQPDHTQSEAYLRGYR